MSSQFYEMSVVPRNIKSGPFPSFSLCGCCVAHSYQQGLKVSLAATQLKTHRLGCSDMLVFTLTFWGGPPPSSQLESHTGLFLGMKIWP